MEQDCVRHTVGISKYLVRNGLGVGGCNSWAVGVGVGWAQDRPDSSLGSPITGSQGSAGNFSLGNWSYFILTARQNVVKTELSRSDAESEYPYCLTDIGSHRRYVSRRGASLASQPVLSLSHPAPDSPFLEFLWS